MVSGKKMGSPDAEEWAVGLKYQQCLIGFSSGKLALGILVEKRHSLIL